MIEGAFSEVANKKNCEREEEAQDNYKCPVCGCYHMHFSLSEWQEFFAKLGNELLKDLIYYHRKQMAHLYDKPGRGSEFLTTF